MRERVIYIYIYIERERQRERESMKGDTLHFFTSDVRRPAVEAPGPRPTLGLIGLRSKRACFSKTYGLNNTSTLFPSGWSEQKKEKNVHVRESESKMYCRCCLSGI